MVKASSIGLGFKAMLADMGVTVGITVSTDAEAAKGMAMRSGLGKVRHVGVHLLWVQEKVRDGSIVLRKVKGTSNPADLLTKYLPHTLIAKYMDIVALRFQEGRASVTPLA